MLIESLFLHQSLRSRIGHAEFITRRLVLRRRIRGLHEEAVKTGLGRVRAQRRALRAPAIEVLTGQLFAARVFDLDLNCRSRRPMGCIEEKARLDRKSTRLNSSHLGISY